jgi:hypothetical protein
LKKIFSYILLMPILASLTTLLVLPANAVIQEQPCNTYSWSGEDDTAHQMILTNPLTLGDTTYNTTYVTTNGTLTFGTPDANFSSYPNTPSISLAGYDWVTFGEGASLSYGSTSTGFCVEWRVRPFPQSTGDLTIIKLTVDTSKLPSWSGIIETTGWLPTDLRRGIRFAPGQDVVTISEAFSINGGVPVEMQTCWDGSIIPLSSTCPAEPPPGQCWDGSTIPWNGTCPPIPPDTQCWDGSWVTWSQTCPPQPPPVTCWDGSVIPHNQTCPPTPPDITCWNGEVISWNETCPQMPPMVECWDGSEVNWNEQCPPEPPPTIVYPEGAVYITVDENGQIDYSAPTGMKINQILFASYGTPENYQYGSCHSNNSLSLVQAAINNNQIVIDANNDVFGDPCGGTGKRLSIVITIEVDPTYVAPSPTPTASPEPQPTVSPEPTVTPSPQPTEPSPEPTPTSEPTLEPSPTSTPTPTPSPSKSESVAPVPQPTPSQSPEPEPSSPSEPTPDPTVSPTPDPSPSSTDLPSDNNITDGLTAEEAIALEELLTEYGPTDPISFESFEESGLDYENLPPDQPVMLENGVILTAEVADAIEIFENPSELLLTVFTDPGKALKAFANIGADMTPEQRKETQAVVVASIIVGQLIASTNLITGRIR